MPVTTEAGHDAGAPRYWTLVAVLLAVYCYAFIDRVILALLVDPIKRDLGASDLHMGLLLGVGFAIFYALFSFPAGYFVDRLNRRTMIGLASVVWALMTIVCGTATSLTQLFIGRAGIGIAESVIMPAAFSLIRDAVPLRSRGLAFSVYAMAPIIGSTTSLLGGGFLLRAATAGRFADWPLLGGLAPWQCTMIVVGLAGLPISMLLLLIREPARSTAPSAVPDAKGFGAAIDHLRTHLPVYLPLILFVTFGAMLAFSSSGWLPTMFARSWGMTPQQVGPLLGSIMLPAGLAGLVFSGFMLNWLTVRGGDIRLYGIVAAVGTMIGLVAAALAPTLPLALTGAAISTFFIGTSTPVAAATLSEVTPSRLMGRITSIYFLFQTLLGQALAPFLIALGSQRIFAGPTALARSMAVNCTMFGIACAIAALVLRAMLRRQRR